MKSLRRLLVAARRSNTPHCKHNKFLAGIFWRARYWGWPLAPMIPRPHTAWFVFCVDVWKTVYRNSPRSLMELEHNIEVIVTSKNEQTLWNVARNIVKRVDACLHEGGGHFQHLLWFFITEGMLLIA
jgi:hypothetical protein